MRKIKRFMSLLLCFAIDIYCQLRKLKKFNINTTQGNKLNIGASTAISHGWINIDNSYLVPISKTPFLNWILYKTSLINREKYIDLYKSKTLQQNYIWYDVRFGLPFEDETFDYIYSSHLLEHLSSSNAIDLLSECYRILKPGGRLRIVVPDLFKASSDYVKISEEVRSGAIDANDEVQYMVFSIPAKDVASHFLRYFYDYGHKWMYDIALLNNILEEQGFSEIRECQYKTGLVPDIDILDCRPESSLHIEALKNKLYQQTDQ